MVLLTGSDQYFFFVKGGRCNFNVFEYNKSIAGILLFLFSVFVTVVKSNNVYNCDNADNYNGIDIRQVVFRSKHSGSNNNSPISESSLIRFYHIITILYQFLGQ